MMGVTKTFNVSTTNSNISGYVNIVEGDYSIANNTSPVTATLYLHRTNTYGSITASTSSNFYITIDGSEYHIVNNGYVEIPATTSSSHPYVTVGSATKTITHSDDGSKSISVSTRGTMPYAGSGITMNSQSSGSFSLTTIPRASSVACSSPNIGDTATITISKKVASFTSTVTYNIGGITGTLATKTADTVLSLDTNTIKSQIYALIPNAKSTTGTIYCTTYSGNTQIGSTQSATFNLYAVESDCKPTVSGVVIDTNADTITLTQDNTILVKNASKPKVTITATPKYSSTISSYLINLNDGQTSNLQEATFDTINSNSITVDAYDSREYHNPQTIDLTNRVVNYVTLHFNSVNLERTEGISNEVILNADGVWFNGNFRQGLANTLTCSFSYKKADDSSWTSGGTINATISGNTFSFSNFSLGSLYNYDYEYQFKIIATDRLMTVGNDSTDIQTVPRGVAVVEIGDELVNINGILTVNDLPISGSDTVPIGSIFDYDGNSVPSGYEEVGSYSLNETLTGDSWIDGKPIYRKIIQLSQNISASTTSVSIQLPLTNVDRIWLNSKSTIIESNNVQVPFPNINGATTSYIMGYYMAVVSGVPEVRIRKGNGLGILSEEFVVEYTKTTD